MSGAAITAAMPSARFSGDSVSTEAATQRQRLIAFFGLGSMLTV